MPDIVLSTFIHINLFNPQKHPKGFIPISIYCHRHKNQDLYRNNLLYRSFSTRSIMVTL